MRDLTDNIFSQRYPEDGSSSLNRWYRKLHDRSPSSLPTAIDGWGLPPAKSPAPYKPALHEPLLTIGMPKLQRAHFSCSILDV
jgi:hypothetical protein